MARRGAARSLDRLQNRGTRATRARLGVNHAPNLPALQTLMDATQHATHAGQAAEQVSQVREQLAHGVSVPDPESIAGEAMNEHFTPGGWVRVVRFQDAQAMGQMLRVAVGAFGQSNAQEIPEQWWLERTGYHARRGCNAVAACWWSMKEWEQVLTQVSDN